MQILQWLFKVAHEQGGPNTNKETAKDQEDKLKDIVLSKNRRSKSKKFKPFIFLCNKDVANACFYSSIYLRRVGSSHRRHHQSESTKMNKEDNCRGLAVSHKSDSAIHAGNKVLPLSEGASVSPSTRSNDQCSTNEKKDKIKGDHKTKAMSRMKELLRWAAAGKSDKGGKLSRKVLSFRNRGALKTVSDDDRFSSNDSPKISFRRDAESSSTSSSAISAISTTASLRNDHQTSCNMVSLNSTLIHGLNRCSSRRGHWITTDSEFVVLEL